MLSVAKALGEAGVEVRFSSSGEVADFIASRGFACNTLPLADVRYSEEGGLAVKETLVSYPMISSRVYRQLRRELSNIIGFGPDAVLSDSVQSTVLAGRMLKKRVVTVVNQIRLEAHGSEGSAYLRLASSAASGTMGAFWSLSDAVLIPDLPPPYTISERNLWNSGVAHARYVGFIIPEDPYPTAETFRPFGDGGNPKVFWPISGPGGTRAPLVKKALEIARALSARYSFVISAGNPRGDTTPTKVEGGWYYGWCDTAQRFYRECDVVVSRAGHGTIAQSIASSKPSILVPIPNQTEQDGNAKKAVKLGISVRLPQEELSVGSMRSALVQTEEGGLSESVARLSRVAGRYDAKAAIIETLGNCS